VLSPPAADAGAHGKASPTGCPPARSGGEKLVRFLAEVGREASSSSHAEMPPLRLLVRGLDHALPPKKPPRDESLRAPDGRPTEAYSIGGLLKANWLHKHFALLPAVVILALPFQFGLTPSGWVNGAHDIHFPQYALLNRRGIAQRNARVFCMATARLHPCLRVRRRRCRCRCLPGTRRRRRVLPCA